MAMVDYTCVACAYVWFHGGYRDNHICPKCGAQKPILGYDPSEFDVETIGQEPEYGNNGEEVVEYNEDDPNKDR